MKCPKCKTDNPENKKFCRECGADLVQFCPECGAEVLSSDKFCGECRCDLRKDTKVHDLDFNKPKSYTPQHLADKILTNRSAMEGERKLVTVLFADIAGYTSLSEKLDPEEVHQIMDGCFKILMDEIHKYEGTINQFTGDGVMALFGAPVAHEDHAQRACYTALSVQDTIGKYGDKIKKDTGLEFKMRVGINSGHVIVGSIGDDLRMDYTAVGDTTNLASRMESRARAGSTIISKNTQRLVNDYFELKSLGMMDLKGKEEPQEAFELIKTGEVDTRIKASVVRGLTRFVGRRDSMATVMETYEKAKSGTGQVLALVGEAGVGKSRLLLEMRNKLPHGDYTYLEGQCLHYGGSIAYLPILDILRACFGILERDREYIINKKMNDKIIGIDEKLNDIIPPLQELMSLKVDDEAFTQLEPKKKRERTFESIRNLLIHISQQNPLILAIEDLHWMDKTSEEFLDYFIGWLANSPILLILLYRPEYTHPWGSKSYYTKVGLDQLGVESSGELVKAMLEQGEIAPEIKNLILKRAAGNPLFMEEFTHTLLENGTIERKDNRYVLSSKEGNIHIPDTVQGIIAARMDRLEDNIKRTMQVASVIGRDFAFRILQTITGMREELKSYLLNLQGLEFIYEKKLFPELEYIFKHALTQEVAYNSLLLTRRKEIHEKTGKAIEQIYAERLEEFYEMLAYHYGKGENLEKSYHYLKLSGDKATNNYANSEALGFYKEALEALNRMPDTLENKKRQLGLRMTMWPIMESLGFPEGSLEILMDGKKIAQEIEDKRSLALAYSKLGNYYIPRGNKLEAIEYSAKGFEEAEKNGDISLIAPIGLEYMNSTWQYGDCVRGVDIASKVIHVIEKNKRESDFFGRPFNVYAELHGLCALSYAYLGKFDEGIASGMKALRFAIDIQHLPSRASSIFLLAVVFSLKGDGENAIKHGKAAIEYCTVSETNLFLPLANQCLGCGYLYSGELKTADEYSQIALQLQKDMGLQMFTSWIYLNLGYIEVELGNLKSARSHAENALNSAQKNSERNYEGNAWIFLGRILGKEDPPDYDKAKEYILEGIKILEGFKTKSFYSKGYLYLGELYADMGRKGEALENLKKAEDNFWEMGMDYYLQKAQEALKRL